jgi:two-component system, NarL family, nitrate/nitrite response regulator NarL
MFQESVDATSHRILIAGDLIPRRGLGSIVQQVLPRASIVEASCFSDAKSQLECGEFFAVIFHIDCRDTTEIITFLRMLRADHPMLITAVLSRTDDAAVILRYLSEGVNGYILECSSHSEIERAVGAIIARAIYIPPSVLANSYHSKQDVVVTSPKPRALTQRQLAVLKLLLNSLSNKDIARELGLSHHTIKIHVGALLRHFSAKNRVELILSASQTYKYLCDNDYILSPLIPFVANLPSRHSSRRCAVSA